MYSILAGALLTVAGATCGVGVQVAATFAGMASFMLLLAEGFEWLRWAGVAYLLYLGIVNNDYTLISGIVFILILGTATAVLILDLILPIFDPRITYQKG